MDIILEERKKIKEDLKNQLRLINRKLDLEAKNAKYRDNEEFREAVKKKNRQRYQNMVLKRKEEEMETSSENS
jgi:hypothetical protein